MPTRPPGLYVHVPFCRRKCPYCGFASGTDLARVPSFLAGLAAEIALYGGSLLACDTLYIGGGTPSVLTAAQLAAVLDKLRRHFTLTADAELTVEINPGDASPAYLRELRDAGVNRLSVGVQSFDDAALALLGRRHGAREAAATLAAAREAGFTNVGVDLIYGLPSSAGADGGAGEAGAQGTFARWEATLASAVAFAPEHLSCYELTVEEGTPLAARVAAGELAMPGEELQLRYFLHTAQVLAEAGYEQYEVSNFARRPDCRSRHNGKYWDHTSYLGLGPAAHSFDGARRRWNHRDLGAWFAALRAGRSPVAGSEALDAEQLRLETIALGLRTAAGIDLAAYRVAFGADLADAAGPVPGLVREGYLRATPGRLQPTRKGMASADALARVLA